MKIPAEKYVELYSDLAEAIMANGASGMSDYLVEDDNGDIRYTDEGQELFIDFCELVCGMLDNAGIESE